MPVWKKQLLVGVLFALGALLAIWTTTPRTWDKPLKLNLALQGEISDPGEPLVSTGKYGLADFLLLRKGAPGTAQICYDSWGGKLISSAPFPVSADKPLAIELIMPSLHTPGPAGARIEGRLFVKVDGRVVLETKADAYACTDNEIYFAENQIGGSSCINALHGSLTRENTLLKGKIPPPSWTFAKRMDMFASLPAGYWLAWFLTSAAAGVLSPLVTRHPALRSCFKSIEGRRAFLVFSLCLAGCVTLFVWLATYGTGRLLEPESFGNYYEFQAKSILEGRLDIPRFCISDEAFLYKGKTYGYHGVTPALLRIPLLVFNANAGCVSRLYMTLYYAAALTGVFAILRLATKAVRGEQAEPAAWSVATITLLAGLGSTMFFLSSRSYLYHEAIMSGISMGLLSCACSLAWLTAPRARWWIGSLFFGILAVNARPPAGLFALTFTGVSAVILCLNEAGGLRPLPSLLARLLCALRQNKTPLVAALLCAPCLLTYNVISHLKFETWDSCPLRYNIQYAENPGRLAKIGNDQFYASNIPFNLDGYLTGMHVRLNKDFPFLHASKLSQESTKRTDHIDMAEDTVSIPIAMPGLFLLSVLGCAVASWSAPRLRPWLAVAWLTLIPLGLAMLATVVISHRYTGDFVPFLCVTACLGLVGAEEALPRARRVLTAVLAPLVLLSALISLALSIEYQRVKVWGVDEAPKTQYQNFKHKIDRLLGSDN